MVVVVAVSVVAPLLLLVVVLIKCLGCLRKKEGFKTFENEDARTEARINPGFAMGQDVDDRDQTMSTTIQIEPLPELLAESTPRKPKIACVEKTKQEAAFKLVVINNPHPFPRRQLTYLKEIGNGWFGQVLESDAEHITTGIPLSRVVAKVLRDDASNSEKKLFLEDVVPYRELEHSNVLRLLGQCTESAPYLMILEYAQMGDLKTCVKKLKDRADVMTQNYQVVKLAIDAASGLACLHRHGYIHQDFAARNCVVMADYTVKIGDYGISEDVFKEDYYISGKESLPIRWMAPETLSQQSGSWQTAVITREANIWSFGVLLWEVLMFGKQPYGNMSDEQVLQTVIADRMVKLPEPDVNIQFKDRIVEVMLFCWLNPGERPSIEDAHGLLQRLYEIVVGDQVKAENFEKKWNQMIPHEARIVSATQQPKQQKRPTSASFDNNFVQEPKPEPQQALTEQSVKPGDLVSVKVEDMSTSVVNGDHIAINMQPSLAGNLAQLPTPSRHTLPAHMTSTPIMDLAPTPAEPDVSQKQKSGSGSRTSRKIEDEFSIAQAASTKSNSGSMASPVPSEDKTPDGLIDVPQGDTAADLQEVLGKEEIVPVSDQFDLLGEKTAVATTQPSPSVDVLEAVGEPVQDVQNKAYTQEANKQEQASVNSKDPFADLFGQGDIADQIKLVSSQPNSSSEPTNGNQSLLSESSPKCDAESPVSGFDEPDTKAEPVGKQTASSDTRPDTDVEPQNFLSNDVDLVSSHNFQAESIIPSTFHPSERSAGEPVSKGENVKPSDLALDNGTSGYETPADQSVKSDSIEENTSGAESSSDSAVCVSSPELADAPSSFDGAAPSHEKVGTCVEYVSDDESKSSSSESDSSSDSSNSGSSYVCEESRRIIQVTDLDADDDDSDNLDEHQDNISDEVTDSDEDLDLRLASELYLSKGVSSPRVFERPPLETIPEDVMPSPSDTSSIDLKFDAHFDDVFASQDNFEWDDFMGESIVGRDRTSNTPKASFDMSDWLMDGDSLSYRSSGSIQSPLESVSPDVLGTTDPSIRLSTASTSEQPSLGPTDATFSVQTAVSSAPKLEADVTNQKLPSEQRTEESPDPSDNFKGFGGIDSGKGNVNEQGQPKKKPVPEDLESAFEELASQHGIDLFGSGEVSNTSHNQYNEFSFETLGKSDDVNLFDDFISPDTSDKSEVPSVAAFFTGLDIPEIPVASKAVDVAPVKPLEDDPFSRETVISHTASNIDIVTPEVDSSSVICTEKSESHPQEYEKREFNDINRAPSKNDHSAHDPAESCALTQSDIIGKSSTDESAKTQQFIDPETNTVSFSDFDATDSFQVQSVPDGQSVNIPHIPLTSDLEPPPTAESAIDIAGTADVSSSSSQESVIDSLTQAGDSLVNVDEAPLDCQVVGLSMTSGSSVIHKSVVSLEDAEITSKLVGGSESEVGKIFSSYLLHEDSLTSPDVEKHSADKPDTTGLEPSALVNQNRGDDSVFVNVEAESEVSVKHENSDVNFEKSFSFTIGPHYSPQGKENYESEDNTSFDMVETSSDVEIITESPFYSMDELHESEIAVVSEPVDIVPSDLPANMSLFVKIGRPSTDAVQDSMPYAGPTATADLLPVDADSNRDKIVTDDIEAHDVAGVSDERLVIMDTDKNVDTVFGLEELTLSTESNSTKEVMEPNFRHSESGTDKADEVIACPGPVPGSVSEDEPEDASSKIDLQSMMAIEQTKDMVEDHGVSGQELHSSGSQLDDDVQQILNQTDVFEVLVSNQSAVVEKSNDLHISDVLIPNKESDDLDLFSSDSLVAQDNDVCVKPDFQTDIVDDNLSPVQLIDQDEIQTTSLSHILTEDAVCETGTEKEIHTFETNSPIQGVSPELHHVPSSEQIPVPSDLSLVPDSPQVTEDKIVETPQPQDKFSGVNMSQQIPSDEDDGFTDLEGFNRTPVSDDLPSISDSEEFTSFTDSKSLSDVSIHTKENTTEVTATSSITSNVINDIGLQFIPGMDNLEERTPEQNDAPDFTSHVSEHDAPEEDVEKRDQTGSELTSLIMANSLKTEDVVESESVKFVENAINVNASGSSFSLKADADHHDEDVPSQPVKPFDSDSGPNELKCESAEHMTSQFDFHVTLDTGHSDKVSSSEQMSWASDASEAGSDQSINDFEDLGMATPEQVELSQTGDGSTVSADSLLDGFVEISRSPEGFGISETSEAERKLDSNFPENTETGQGGETVDVTGDGFLVLGRSEEDKQAKLYNELSTESKMGQGIIDFPDSSLTDSQESAAFLDLSSSQEGVIVDSNEFVMDETCVMNKTYTVTEITRETGWEQPADSGVVSMSPPKALSQTEEIILKPSEDLSSDLSVHSSRDMGTTPAVSKAAQVIPPEDSVSLSPTDNNMETNLPFNTITPINNDVIGINGLLWTMNSDANPVQIPSAVTTQNEMKGDLTSSNESSVLGNDDSDMILPVMNQQTEDSDPFGLTSSENTVSNLEASDIFPSIETVQTEDSDPFGLVVPSDENTVTDPFPSMEPGLTPDSDPFGLKSSENTVPKLESPGAYTSVETEQAADIDSLVLETPGENTFTDMTASDPFPSVECGPVSDSDPFDLTSSENTVPNQLALDAFPSIETEQTAGSDPIGLAIPSSENSDSNLVASDQSPSVEPGPTSDTDLFGLAMPSGENAVTDVGASDAFPSVEPGPTSDSEPFGLKSSEITVSKLESSDAFLSTETEEITDTGSFGLATPSGENTDSSPFPSLEPGPTTDSDLFDLTSIENAFSKQEASDAVSSIETEQTTDSDPFGLTTPFGKNTNSNLVASDVFPSMVPGSTSDTDPFGLATPSGENTVTDLEASNALYSVEPGPSTDDDPFDLKSSEDSVPKLKASDAFSAIETEHTAESDPSGPAHPSGENTDLNFVASGPFPSVLTGPTTDTDPFDLKSSEDTVPKLEASDAVPSIETEQTAESDPFGLATPFGENTVTSRDSSDPFPPVVTGPTSDSDPFDQTSSDDTVPKFEASDAVPSIETEQTAESDPFGLATPFGENTVTNRDSSDPFPSMVTGPTSGSDPFGLTSSENMVPKFEASDAVPSIETEQTAESDPFGLAIPRGENTVRNQDASDPFPPVVTGPITETDPFDLKSNEDTVPQLEASDAVPSIKTEQTAESDSFGLATSSDENIDSNLLASDPLPSVEPGPTTDSDPFGLTSSENMVPKLEASDAFLSKEIEQTAERNPFGHPFDLKSNEDTVPKFEASDAVPSMETEQTAYIASFGLTTPSDENTDSNLLASDPFLSVEPGPITDTDPFDLKSNEDTVPKLEASDAVPSMESEQTAESDPFGLATPPGENTDSDLVGSDAYPSVEPGPTSESDPFGNSSNDPNLGAQDMFPSVETEQTAESDPFGHATPSGENPMTNRDASDPFPSVATGPITETDPFDLKSSEDTVPKFEASDAAPSMETEQTAESDPFGLATPFGENPMTNRDASDPFPSVATGPTTETDPFGLTFSENMVPKLEASDAFPSKETEQTAERNPFGHPFDLKSNEDTVPKFEASDAVPSMEKEQTAESDPFGLAAPSGENTVTNEDASDPFPSVLTGPTTDTDPFDLKSSEDTVPKFEASDAVPSIETEQTAYIASFGLPTPSDENTDSNLLASDPFPSVEPGPTTDTDPFGLTSSENMVPKLEASDAVPSMETEQTAESDPFGLAAPSGENTVTNEDASDPFPSVVTGPITETDPFDLKSSEDTVPKLEASDAVKSIETEQTVESDPFGLAIPSGENTVTSRDSSDSFLSMVTRPTSDTDPFDQKSSEDTVPKLETSDAAPSIETEQTAESDPFGLATPFGENTVRNQDESDPFPSVVTGPTSDSDPFGLTFSENMVPKLEVSDAVPSMESEQTAESDPFGLATPPGENTDSDLVGSDAYPSVEPGPTSESDPFGNSSNDPNLGAQDMFPSVETGQTAINDPFGLATPPGENTLTNMGASVSHASFETGKDVDSYPFGSASSQDESVNSCSEQIFSAETSQVTDSDPCGMTNLSQNDTVPNLRTLNIFSPLQTDQTADSDPIGLSSPGESTLTNLVTSDPFSSVVTEQRADSDPFGLTSSENTETNPSALNVFPPLETSQMATSDPFGLISHVEPSKLETCDMFDVSAGSSIERVTTQNPMTDSGMLLDFVQYGSEAPSQTNSGTSAEMFGSSPDSTSPSSTQASGQSAADTKESDQLVLLDMFEKPSSTQNIEPQSSDTSTLVNLF
ncbi:uncharacterized protein [Haliotis asinina]|uniref:uncharacterized protein isoform X2 n=1 Tax=Haliotis asinina TaxID=109174 RepID=UPI003531A1C9